MAEGRVFSFNPDDHAGIPAMRRRLERLEAEQAERMAHPQPATYTCPDCGATHSGWADGRYVSKWWCAACYRRREETTTDTPEQIARASIAAYREFAERYGHSPDAATEAAVRELLEAGGWPVGDGTPVERPPRAQEVWKRPKVQRQRTV